MTHRWSLLCVWPVEDDRPSRDALVAAGEADLDQVAAEAGARVPYGAAITWRITEPGDLPGWEWHPGRCLIATVAPAEPLAADAPPPATTQQAA